MEANTGVSFLFGGVLLFPIVLLLVYFSLSLHAALIYTLIVMLFIKMLAFYKSYTIFFKRMGARSANNFVLLCARSDAGVGIMGCFDDYR